MTTENSRADAPTDEQIASAWFATSDARNLRPHERAVEVVRKFLAASPAPQPSPSPSPADERAAFEAFARGIRMDVSVSLEGHYTDAATAYAWAAWRTRAASANQLADERATFDSEVGNIIADAATRGIAWMAFKVGARYARAASANDTGAEAVAIPQSVINALRFYANGHHFNIDEDHQQFDTVSGEPQNWLCSERDDDCTMIEDGSIAKAALCGGVLGFEESEKPIEGEVFTAAQQPAQADARVGLTDEQIMNIADSYSFKWDEGIIAFARALLATPQPEPRAEVTDTQRLDWLRDECCDLRSVSVPTGGDDYEVNWIVIQHHMIAPHEREIGRGFSDDPRDAIDAARTGASS